MSTDVDVDFLLKLHEEDGSSIIDGGHFPYQREVEQHDVGKASQIQRQSGCVEAFPFPSTTNSWLIRLYREHPILEGIEVFMI